MDTQLFGGFEVVRLKVGGKQLWVLRQESPSEEQVVPLMSLQGGWHDFHSQLGYY